MRSLRRALYLEAALLAVSGLGFAAAPRWTVTTILGQKPLADWAWVRILGVEALALALLAVPIVHRAKELWLWAWPFALAAAGIAAVALLEAALGRPAHTGLWWGLGIGGAALFGILLWGIARAAAESPP